ncbi:MAG: hypothetical protein HQL37_09980 [Alphaproteobacteria bacterium]|nr:hypothetical protein [Alphaproteobacteria bacterium]
MTDEPVDKPSRRYSAADVREIVEVFRDAPDISPEKFSGMLGVAKILEHYETMTDQEIINEIRHFRRASALARGR